MIDGNHEVYSRCYGKLNKKINVDFNYLECYVSMFNLFFFHTKSNKLMNYLGSHFDCFKLLFFCFKFWRVYQFAGQFSDPGFCFRFFRNRFFPLRQVLQVWGRDSDWVQRGSQARDQVSFVLKIGNIEFLLTSWIKNW